MRRNAILLGLVSLFIGGCGSGRAGDRVIEESRRALGLQDSKYVYPTNKKDERSLSEDYSLETENRTREMYGIEVNLCRHKSNLVIDSER
jgi:hypothetical protein